MAEYCTQADIQNRLTEAGLRFVADRDRSGTISTAEATAYITSAIEYAGGIIDHALCERLAPASARAQATAGTCTWLRDRAIDIAAFRAAGHGGRDVPETLRQAYDLAEKLLYDARVNRRAIPGLVEDRPANGRSTIGPRVVNPR